MAEIPDYSSDVPRWAAQLVSEYVNDPAAYIANLRNLCPGASPETIRWLEWIASEGRRLTSQQAQATTAPREDTVTALAGRFREQLQRDQAAGMVALSCSELAAWQVTRTYPDLDDLIACCGAGPGDRCPFCDGGDFPHMADPQPVPAWAIEAQQAKLAAQVTLAAIGLAHGRDGSEVMLTVPPPVPPPRAAAPPYEYRPAIERLSHPGVRQRLGVEGPGTRPPGTPPPAVFAGPGQAAPRRGRRRR